MSTVRDGGRHSILQVGLAPVCARPQPSSGMRLVFRSENQEFIWNSAYPFLRGARLVPSTKKRKFRTRGRLAEELLPNLKSKELGERTGDSVANLSLDSTAVPVKLVVVGERL